VHREQDSAGTGAKVTGVVHQQVSVHCLPQPVGGLAHSHPCIWLGPGPLAQYTQTHTEADTDTCMYTHGHTQRRASTQTHRHLQTQTHTHKHTCRHRHTHARTDTCTQTHACIHTDTHTDTYTHRHTDTHKHTGTHKHVDTHTLGEGRPLPVFSFTFPSQANPVRWPSVASEAAVWEEGEALASAHLGEPQPFPSPQAGCHEVEFLYGNQKPARGTRSRL
jgi:hypothetical protein